MRKLKKKRRVKDGKWSVDCGLGRQLLKEGDERRMGEQMNEWIDMHIDSINLKSKNFLKSWLYTASAVKSHWSSWR